MKPIDYFISYYGTSSWKDLVLAWAGSGTTFNLYQVNNPTPLYTGTGNTYPITTNPNTRGDYTLTTVVGGVTYSATIVAYTTGLPAPTGLAASSIASATASLSWTPVTDVTSYEVGDVTNSYEVEYSVTGNTRTLSGLAPSTRYSKAVRSVYGTERSTWSAPVTFFTSAAITVTPGTYSFRPASIYTWAAGKTGSSTPQWLSATSDWYAGEGSVWGDNKGVLTTFFFYGSPNPFTVLSSGTCTRFQIYLDRNGPSGDPGLVLSRWGLHSYLTPPVGQPAALTSTADVGQMARGGYGWIDLPVSWGQQLIGGTAAFGLAWGGTPERYQSSLYADLATSPRTGDLQLTVA